jgi:hypothetical protein
MQRAEEEAAEGTERLFPVKDEGEKAATVVDKVARVRMENFILIDLSFDALFNGCRAEDPWELWKIEDWSWSLVFSSVMGSAKNGNLVTRHYFAILHFKTTKTSAECRAAAPERTTCREQQVPVPYGIYRYRGVKYLYGYRQTKIIPTNEIISGIEHDKSRRPMTIDGKMQHKSRKRSSSPLVDDDFQMTHHLAIDRSKSGVLEREERRIPSCYRFLQGQILANLAFISRNHTVD